MLLSVGTRASVSALKRFTLRVVFFALNAYVWHNRRPFGFAVVLVIVVALISSAAGKTSNDRLCGQDGHSTLLSNGACVRDGHLPSASPFVR